MKFGERIKALRTEKRLTLDALAGKSGASKGYIWELENKNPPRPSAEKLSAIAAVLGVTVDYLYGRDRQGLASAQDKAFFQFYSDQAEVTRAKIRAMAKLMAA